MFLDTLAQVAQIVGEISGIIAFIILIVKPVREKLLGAVEIREGQKCLLRQQMLNTYYRHKNENRIRQYEYENFLYSYTAYKAMGGNSFIDKIKTEVDTWEVET